MDSKSICSSEQFQRTVEKRSRNFQKSEVDLLLDLVTSYKNILECKVTDKVSHKEKESAWLELANKFNQQSGLVYRDGKTLKNKYDNIKKTSKKKWAEEKRYVLGTGGGPSKNIPITDTDVRVKELLGVTQIDGLESYFDSDYIECNEIPTKPTSTQSVSFNMEDNIPVVIEEVSVELVPEFKKTKVDGDLSVPMSSDVELNGGFAKATDFSIKMLKNKTSSPLYSNKKKKPMFDKTRASRQIEDLSAAKIELISLQKTAAEEQLNIFQRQQEKQNAEHEMRIKYIEEEHKMKMKCIEEEHKMKMKLLQLQVKEKELDLSLRQ